MNLKSLLRMALVVPALLCVFYPVRAADTANTAQIVTSPSGEQRDRIGVALAGGSALGLAHIGVLQWLEEHKIPVDCIAGTSMGGLVGGFYATGMAPDEMRSLIKSLDWDEALRGEPPFAALTLRRKEDARAVPGRLEAGLRDGFNLPGGVNPAHPVGMLLSRVALPYSTIQSFDELPIPFACMAVDLSKQPKNKDLLSQKNPHLVTLRNGSLAEALRATMAIPGVFTPVRRGSQVLVDGGLLNNLPVEAAREMKANVVIAVDLHASSEAAPRLKSLIDILGQSVAIAVYDNERRSLANADIIIAPDLSGLSPYDFSNPEAFIERGYQEAESKKNLLLRFAVSDAQWQQYKDAKEQRRRTVTETPATVSIAGVSSERAYDLQERLRPFAGVRLDTARLENKLTSLTGEGRYESFLYEQVRRSGKPGETTDLLIRAVEKEYGPPFLRLGFEANGAEADNLQFGIAARLTTADVGAPGAEVRTDLRLGSNKKGALEYYRPLGQGIRQRWFVAPRVLLLDENRQYFQNARRLAIYSERTATAGLDFGAHTGRLSELRFGYEAGYQDAVLRTGSALFPATKGTLSTARLRWAFDGQDSAMIPTRGTRGTVEANWFFQAPGASRAFPRAEMRLSHFWPVKDGAVVFANAGAGTTFGATASPLQQFTLGGPLRLGAFNTDELRGNDYLLLSAGYLHPIGKLPSFLGGKIMAGGWYEGGGAYNRFGDGPFRSNVSIGIIGETPLGPVLIGNSFGAGHGSNFYFSIGRVF